MNNRNSRNHVQNVRNYQKRKQKLYIICVDNTDTEINTWFDKQPNKSESVRSLIREQLYKRKKQSRAMAELRQKRRDQKICIYCCNQDERTLSGKSTCMKCAEKARNRK